MPEFFCTKVKTARSYALMPAHQQDEDALKALPGGRPLQVKVTRMRNPLFHRKIMALVHQLYEHWDPQVEDMPQFFQERGIVPEKNFDRFRKDLIIRAGFYDPVIRLNGDMRVEAKSMSFGALSEDDAQVLFEKFIDIGINHMMSNYTGDQLRQVIEQIEEFE